MKPPSTPFPSATDSARSTAPALPACSAPAVSAAVAWTSNRRHTRSVITLLLRAVYRCPPQSRRSSSRLFGQERQHERRRTRDPGSGTFPGSHAPPIGQLRVARRPNRPPSGPLRAFQPQGHTPTTPLKPLSTPFPSAAASARSTAPPPTSIQCGRSVDDMARHPPHRCRIARNPTPVHSALGERLTYRLLQVQRSLSKESQTSAVTCPPQPDNSASRDDQPRPRSLTTTSHPRVSGVLRYAGESSTPIRAARSPVSCSRGCCRQRACAVRWTVAVVVRTMCSSSGVHQAAVAVLEVRSRLPAPVGGRLHGAAGDRRVVEFSNEVRTALGTGWSDASGRLPPGRGARTADGAADMGRRWQLRVPRAEDQREHNPARGVIHNVHRIKPPSPAPPPPFTATCF